MSQYKTLLLPILDEILLSEIGEADLDPLDWTKLSDDSYSFPVEINDAPEEVKVNFETITGDVQKQYLLPIKHRNLAVQNVAYSVAGSEKQFARSSVKTLLTILSTVVDIIKHHIENTDVEALYIKATEKGMGGEEKGQKANLYKAYIEKQLGKIPGYGVDTYRDGYIIVRLK